MADYYRIETSNQTVTGTAAGEMFELIPSTNNGLSNIIINAAGGADTLKVSSSNASISATIMNLDPSSVLDLPGSSYYYSTQADGINITNSSGSLNLKLWGTTNTSIFANSNASFTSLDQQTTANGQKLEGTYMADNLVVAHSNCEAYGSSDNDVIVAYGDNNSVWGGYHDDTIITTGNNNILRGGQSYDSSYGGQDVFIVGGSNNSVRGYSDNDTFEIYSYTAGGSNNTLTGGGGYNTYIMSTGLVGVDGSAVNTAAYNPNFSDTVTVTITDAKSGDSYYMRDWGIYGINASATSDGVVISSTSGRINVTMAGQRDWNAVKNNLITLDNAQGYVGTYTLEQAVGLASSGPIPPAGVFTNGDYLLVSSGFVGNLIMSTSGANYSNDQIVTIDATQNYQVGMQLGGNRNSNAIYAGQGGNILWGGQDTATDYLFGGAGTDVFQVGKGDGSDVVFGSDYTDVVHLYDVSVSDIVSYGYDTNTIALGLNSGSVISVANGDVISPTFVLADGSAYRFNRVAYSWQGA